MVRSFKSISKRATFIYSFHLTTPFLLYIYVRFAITIDSWCSFTVHLTTEMTPQLLKIWVNFAITTDSWCSFFHFTDELFPPLLCICFRSAASASFLHKLQGIYSQYNGVWFKEYSLEVRAELPQTKVVDSQPSPRAGRPKGLVELSATEVWGNQP